MSIVCVYFSVFIFRYSSLALTHIYAQCYNISCGVEPMDQYFFQN